MSGLTKEQLQSFEDNGFYIARGLITKEEIEIINNMKKRIDEEVKDCDRDFRKNGALFNFERVGQVVSNDAPGEIRKGVLRKIQEVFFIEKEFKDICTKDAVLDIVESVLGDTIYYHSSKLMCKPVGGREKPWHQDFAYWKLLNGRQITVWFAIDPATKENGCIEVIPGSHKKGLVEHFGPELQFKLEDHYKEEDIVYAEMEPGDVLFFDVCTFHGSKKNNSNKRRLSCIVDFQDQVHDEKWNELKEPLRAPAGV